MVDLINLVGTDTNQFDNWAQENLKIVASVTSSPFHPVATSFSLANPYDRDALFYFRADGAPKGWKVDISPRKMWLKPGRAHRRGGDRHAAARRKGLHERAHRDHELDVRAAIR